MTSIERRLFEAELSTIPDFTETMTPYAVAKRDGLDLREKNAFLGKSDEMKERQEAERGLHVQTWEGKAMIYSGIIVLFVRSHPNPLFPRGERDCASSLGSFNQRGISTCYFRIYHPITTRPGHLISGTVQGRCSHFPRI
jgi:hypothetical protein